MRWTRSRRSGWVCVTTTTRISCRADSSSASRSRALITQPSIILADEPTGNLDTRTSIEVMGIFQKLNIERGITIILITHEMDIASATRLVRFRDGKIQVDQKIAKRRDAADELAALPPPEPDLQNVVGDPVSAEHLGGVS